VGSGRVAATPDVTKNEKRFLVGLAAAGLKIPKAFGSDDHHNITRKVEVRAANVPAAFRSYYGRYERIS
jgi:hypothetical protein